MTTVVVPIKRKPIGHVTTIVEIKSVEVLFINAHTVIMRQLVPNNVCEFTFGQNIQKKKTNHFNVQNQDVAVVLHKNQTCKSISKKCMQKK